MKNWLKIIAYFILAFIILIIPMALYSFTENNSMLYSFGAFVLSGLIALKLGKVF
jgi:hypothetical protein